MGEMFGKRRRLVLSRKRGQTNEAAVLRSRNLLISEESGRCTLMELVTAVTLSTRQKSTPKTSEFAIVLTARHYRDPHSERLHLPAKGHSSFLPVNRKSMSKRRRAGRSAFSHSAPTAVRQFIRPVSARVPKCTACGPAPSDNAVN